MKFCSFHIEYNIHDPLVFFPSVDEYMDIGKYLSEFIFKNKKKLKD